MLLTLRVLADTPDNRRAVEGVLIAATDYQLLVENRPPNPGHVEEFFTEVPSGYTLADLFPLGFEYDGELVGVGGVLRGWNAPHKAIIGLLVFAPAQRGKGFGLAALAEIEALARQWPGIDTLRVAVVTTNQDGLAFWRKAGFIETGEIKPAYGVFIADIVILEKSLRNTEPA